MSPGHAADEAVVDVSGLASRAMGAPCSRIDTVKALLTHLISERALLYEQLSAAQLYLSELHTTVIIDLRHAARGPSSWCLTGVVIPRLTPLPPRLHAPLNHATLAFLSVFGRRALAGWVPSVARQSRSRLATMAAAPPAAALRVALCQLPVTADKTANLDRARAAIDAAVAGAPAAITNGREAGRGPAGAPPPATPAGVGLVVLPECFNCPYDTSVFSQYSEPVPPVGTPLDGVAEADSPTVAMLQRAAAAAGAVVVGGSLPEAGADGAVYNTCVVVGADGTILATHRKVHLFDVNVPGGVCFKESDALTAGGAVTSFSMGDPVGTVGVGICYDVRFPEYAGVLVRERGAQLLVFPGAFNSTTGPAHWELLLRARALDGQCYVVACSPAWGVDGDGGGGSGYEAWGHSMVVGPWGDVRVVAGRGQVRWRVRGLALLRYALEWLWGRWGQVARVGSREGLLGRCLAAAPG